MTEEDRKEWIWYAYRDAMELHTRRNGDRTD